MSSSFIKVDISLASLIEYQSVFSPLIVTLDDDDTMMKRFDSLVLDPILDYNVKGREQHSTF